jgi:histone deacetylase 1/2
LDDYCARSKILFFRNIIYQQISFNNIKHLGDLEFFLGIEVRKLPDGSLHLSQAKYIRDLLEKVGISNARGLKSPMSSSCKLTNEGTDYATDPTLCHSVVGTLQYVTLTRPELRYLARTIQHGLLMKPCSCF